MYSRKTPFADFGLTHNSFLSDIDGTGTGAINVGQKAIVGESEVSEWCLS